ncbi:hypothetical protein CBR_g15951 [Chara braunii]|uniref:Uncharacterized protein n=1 Tax=Chara braunii TaxID=69332 RepID=A0A388JSP9_CHABU|nr:hypothetical protein CBR_g15951 [Chara braunii]|eukprot:GBG60828.1 hypothetical protein CBR_g15951 [Chara braunii]
MTMALCDDVRDAFLLLAPAVILTFRPFTDYWRRWHDTGMDVGMTMATCGDVRDAFLLLAPAVILTFRPFTDYWRRWHDTGMDVGMTMATCGDVRDAFLLLALAGSRVALDPLPSGPVTKIQKESTVQAIQKESERLEFTEPVAEVPVSIRETEPQMKKERQQVPPKPPLQVVVTRAKESDVLQATVDDLHTTEDRENPQDSPSQLAAQIEEKEAVEVETMVVGLPASGLSHLPQVEMEKLQDPPNPPVQSATQIEGKEAVEVEIKVVGLAAEERQIIEVGRPDEGVSLLQPEKARLPRGEEDKRQDSLNSPVQSEEQTTEKEVVVIRGLPAASTQYAGD